MTTPYSNFTWLIKSLLLCLGSFSRLHCTKRKKIASFQSWNINSPCRLSYIYLNHCFENSLPHKNSTSININITNSHSSESDVRKRNELQNEASGVWDEPRFQRRNSTASIASSQTKKTKATRTRTCKGTERGSIGWEKDKRTRRLPKSGKRTQCNKRREYFISQISLIIHQV